MNCKKGDWAVVVHRGEFFGYVVMCVEPTVDRFNGAPGWIVRPQLGRWRGARDSSLRPLRHAPGEDETLRIAGLPQKETA